MTTCDILLSRIYSALNNSSSFSHSAFFPLSLLHFSFPFSSHCSQLLASPLFHPLYPPHGLGLLPPFLLLTRKSRVSECSVREIEGERREGTASEGSQRQLSKSCETGLDVYLLAQSAFISTRVTRAVCYLPCRGTYGREYEKSVRKLAPFISCFARPISSSRALRQKSRKSEQGAKLVNARGAEN